MIFIFLPRRQQMKGRKYPEFILQLERTIILQKQIRHMPK